MIILMLIAVYPAALIVAALNDLYEYKIPNLVSMLLVASFGLVSVGMGVDPAIIGQNVGVGVFALIAGVALYALKLIGAGDAKLFAATSLWVGVQGYPTFLISMAIAGAIMAIILLVFRRCPPLPVYAYAPWVFRLHQRPSEMPYAVAISAGGLLTFSSMRYFSIAFGQ